MQISLSSNKSYISLLPIANYNEFKQELQSLLPIENFNGFKQVRCPRGNIVAKIAYHFLSKISKYNLEEILVLIIGVIPVVEVIPLLASFTRVAHVIIKNAHCIRVKKKRVGYFTMLICIYHILLLTFLLKNVGQFVWDSS